MLDGINSEGLVVSILAEEESVERVGREPSSEVGVHELMSMRYLLDNCKNVEESIRAKEKFTLEEIAAINAKVAVPPIVPGDPASAPGRTLWYAQYDLESLTLTVKFYVGEKPDPVNEKTVVLEYSPVKVYGLKQ